MSSSDSTAEKRDLEMHIEDNCPSTCPSTAGKFASSPEDEAEDRIILRKLDLRLLPCTAALLLLSFIDRSNVGNAVIAGLDVDLHLHGSQFNLALTIFYFSYIACEIPSNLLLRRVKAGIWLPSLTVAWGIVGTLMGTVTNYHGLLAARFFLGLCEGGMFPGIVLFLGMFYKRHELQLRMGLFYSAASLSGAFGGLLATGLTKMDGVGGYAGWRWIFIIEGLLTVVVGLCCFFLLPSSLGTVKFLTPVQRARAVARYNTDHNVSVDDSFDWKLVRRGIFNVNTWLISLTYICVLSPIYSYSLFLPTIVRGLGNHQWSTTHVQLLTVPPYVAGAILTVVVSYYSDKYKRRGASILLVLPMAITGYALSISNVSLWVKYAAVFLMAMGTYPVVPGVLAWLNNNMSPHYVKASSAATQLMIGNSAGFIATWVYLKKDAANGYKRGHSINLGLVAGSMLFAGLAWWYNARENRKRDNGERDYRLEGKSEEEVRRLGFLHPEFRMTV